MQEFNKGVYDYIIASDESTTLPTVDDSESEEEHNEEVENSESDDEGSSTHSQSGEQLISDSSGIVNTLHLPHFVI